MRILVTGASGMLGSDLCPTLEAKKHDVYPTDVDTSSGAAFLDVQKRNDVEKMIREIKPDIVLHLAAETDVDKCELEPDYAYSVNALGTQNVALSCQKQDIEMVYVSTIGVFYGDKPEPYTEFDEPNPINVYGKSKLEGERIVSSLLHRYFIIRAGWMIGGGPKRDKKFVGKIIRQLENSNELKAVVDKVGSLTYTADFSRILSELIQTGLYGTYHCTNKGYASRFDVAGKIVEFLGKTSVNIKPVTSAFFPLPAPRARSEASRNYRLDLLNMNRMKQWDEALKEYIESRWKPSNG